MRASSPIIQDAGYCALASAIGYPTRIRVLLLYYITVYFLEPDVNTKFCALAKVTARDFGNQNRKIYFTCTKGYAVEGFGVRGEPKEPKKPSMAVTTQATRSTPQL